MEKELTLREHLSQLNIGDSFVTTANRAAIFVTAKRLNIKVTTTKDGTQTKVERVDISDSKSPIESITDQLKYLPVADRLSVFESFELCCGMNRGDCVCPDDVLDPPKTVMVASAPSFGNDLAAFIANAQAKKGIVSTPIVEDTGPQEPDWRFMKGEKPDYPDNGRCYRRQFLYGTKSIRTVEVDIDDIGGIIEK
jgi:hypothetical protein